LQFSDRCLTSRPPMKPDAPVMRTFLTIASVEYE
jgi:hypothetical protein